MSWLSAVVIWVVPKRTRLGSISVHHRKSNCPACCLFNRHSLQETVLSMKPRPVPSPPPAHPLMLFGRTKASALTAAILEFLGTYIRAALWWRQYNHSEQWLPVCQAADMEKMVFVMFLLFAVLSPLYKLAPLVSGLSVLLFLGFFISLSVCGGSPPPHILIFFVWHLVLSCCFSPSLSPPLAAGVSLMPS